ncbi:DNA-directed RNA polymerase [Trypanosoma rangeli]|uniref:DNA-directed RNA polymerase n=1 Tax=Trypanosoma rangeli TaxID=5698 RepID=A0A3R7NF84_TRYRA|nr:DNA-directed RNA polymerase [Trypanosoma rangeli]RNF01819.1 DNA-directed RNA polymerase [Trypanosoma rangeli]|eukprot:RNF01819.1 DNA-directed RNA polymerase [Trypanosoma rangeli]
MSSSLIRQSSYVLSGSTRRMMSGMTPSRSSFCAMVSGSVSPSKATSTGAFMLICSARVPRMRARSYFVSTGAVTRSLSSRRTAEPPAACPDRTTPAPSPLTLLVVTVQSALLLLLTKVETQPVVVLIAVGHLPFFKPRPPQRQRASVSITHSAQNNTDRGKQSLLCRGTQCGRCQKNIPRTKTHSCWE